MSDTTTTTTPVTTPAPRRASTSPSSLFVRGSVSYSEVIEGVTRDGEVYVRPMVYVVSGREMLPVRWHSERVPEVGATVDIPVRVTAYSRQNGSIVVGYRSALQQDAK